MLIQINTDVHTSMCYSMSQISQVKTDVMFIFEGIAHVGSFFPGTLMEKYVQIHLFSFRENDTAVKGV